jgi:hypothetical protein
MLLESCRILQQHQKFPPKPTPEFYTMPNTKSRRSPQHTTRLEKIIALLPTVAGTGEHSTVQVLTRGPALHLYSFYLLDCDHDDRGTL